MKHLVLFILLFTSITIVAQENKKQEEVCYNPNLVKDTTKKSIKSMAVGLLGNDSVKISYHSPGVRKRIIWGGLVPFEDVWVTGAHDATNITINKPFIINGKELPAGKYAFFTIPGQEQWTVILNKHWNQHLTNEYDAKDDIIHFRVKPKEVSHTERLQYFIEPIDAKQSRIAVAWEKVRIEFPISLK
jgi:hypothetical protein